MKKTCYILLVLISNLTFGQSEFCIHIKSDVTVDSVSVSGMNLSNRLTSEFKNGIARIKTPSKSSDQYSIYIEDKIVNGWFNTGEINIYLDYKKNELSITKTKNTPVYQKHKTYVKAYKDYLNDKSSGTDFIKNAILENDQDAFVLFPLNHWLKLYQNDKKELNFIKAFLEKQPKAIKEHLIYEMVENRLKKLTEINKIELNDYLLIDLNGLEKQIKKEKNNTFTVLDFWFTACPPCIKEHKEILANPNIFSDLNAELIGISTDKEQGKWAKYLEKKNINWKNYRIGTTNLAKDLAIWSYPTYIILDKENNILGSYSNIGDTVNALKK